MNFAVVPAAGKSIRMGRPKLALPLGGRSVLEWVVSALRCGGVEHVLVVVGPHVGELAPIAELAGAHPLVLAEETPDMRATVERGLSWLEERLHPRDLDAWLLVPADYPTLDARVVAALLEARERHPEASIFVPTYEGCRGHPTLVAWRHVAGIRAFPLEKGLNAYFRLHEAETLELPVASASIACDLDTPEEYERLLGEFSKPVG